MTTASAASDDRKLTPAEAKTFVAAFLGWTLDAFDFFLVTFVVVDISKAFDVPRTTVILGITLTLALRCVGALIFGTIADKFGRRGPLMISVLLYSIIEFVTGFSTTITMFLVLRALFGIAMGGEWGVGAALALESLPTKKRGFYSGVLQQGYAFGYLLAAVCFYLVYPHFGWKAMFFVGALPALLVLYIRSQVPESQTWRERKAANIGETSNILAAFVKAPVLFIYAILLMASFNFMSHGSQDLYPTFLREQHGFGVGVTSSLAIVANLGAIAGGTLFGGLSQRIGRKAGIVIAAVLGILAIPLWAFSQSIVLLGLGAFVVQFFVQGAWGIVPVHLNELSPGTVRGTFPGFVYQFGNLLSAGAAQIEASFAKQHFTTAAGEVNYGNALAVIMLVVFIAVAVLTAIGPERRGINFVTD